MLGLSREENSVMATGHADTEQTVLNMLDQHTMMTMDEILRSTQLNFSWAQMYLAIDRLSRTNMIVLSRIDGTYQLALRTHGLSPMTSLPTHSPTGHP